MIPSSNFNVIFHQPIAKISCIFLHDYYQTSYVFLNWLLQGHFRKFFFGKGPAESCLDAYKPLSFFFDEISLVTPHRN